MDRSQADSPGHTTQEQAQPISIKSDRLLGWEIN